MPVDWGRRRAAPGRSAAVSSPQQPRRRCRAPTSTRTTSPKRRRRSSSSTACSRSSASSRDREVGVAGDAEVVVVGDLHPREERVEVVRRSRPRAARSVSPPPSATKRGRTSVGTFTRAKVVWPLSGSRDHHAEAEREVRDVGEGLARADRERRQHREDVAAEVARRAPRARLAEVAHALDDDPVLGERRQQRLGDAACSRAPCSSTRSWIASSVCDGVRPSTLGRSTPASIWSCRPATRTMKNSSRFEA